MSLYSKLYEIVKDELVSREGTKPEQRRNQCINNESTIITKEIIGTILESIERNWDKK